MALQDDAVLALILLNIILTVILLAVYYKNHRLIRSKMTLGMIFFMGAFLLENLLDFYFYNSLLMQAIYGITLFNLIINFLEMIGLLVLLYITWK